MIRPKWKPGQSPGLFDKPNVFCCYPEDLRKTFDDLSIHEKITCKHNARGFHGRWSANSWAYQHERIDLKYYLTFQGNLKGLEHQWLNRKNKSWETINWIKSTYENLAR